MDKLERLVVYVDGRLDNHEDNYDKVVDRFVERTRRLQCEVHGVAQQWGRSTSVSRGVGLARQKMLRAKRPAQPFSTAHPLFQRFAPSQACRMSLTLRSQTTGRREGYHAHLGSAEVADPMDRRTHGGVQTEVPGGRYVDHLHDQHRRHRPPHAALDGPSTRCLAARRLSSSCRANRWRHLRRHLRASISSSPGALRWKAAKLSMATR